MIQLPINGLDVKDGLEVRQIDMEAGEYRYVSTYEHNGLSERYGAGSLALDDAVDGAYFVFEKGAFSGFTNPVSSAAALEVSDGFEMGYYNVSTSIHQRSTYDK